jgi:hypothetical protein
MQRKFTRLELRYMRLYGRLYAKHRWAVIGAEIALMIGAVAVVWFVLDARITASVLAVALAVFFAAVVLANRRSRATR